MNGLASTKNVANRPKSTLKCIVQVLSSNKKGCKLNYATSAHFDLKPFVYCVIFMVHDSQTMCLVLTHSVLDNIRVETHFFFKEHA